jgi:hypothetical protein
MWSRPRDDQWRCRSSRPRRRAHRPCRAASSR